MMGASLVTAGRAAPQPRLARPRPSQSSGDLNGKTSPRSLNRVSCFRISWEKMWPKSKHLVVVNISAVHWNGWSLLSTLKWFLRNLEEKVQIQRLCWLPVVHCARAQLAWSLDEEQFGSDNSNLLKFQSQTAGYKHYETLASQVREWIEVMWWWLRQCSYWSCQRDQPLCHGGGQCQQATSECYKPGGVKRPFSTRLWD